MRSGDFSELLPGTVVRDPITNQPFPNNVIPPSMFNSASVKWQEMFFPPSNFGAPNLTVANFRGTYPQDTHAGPVRRTLRSLHIHEKHYIWPVQLQTATSPRDR